MSRRGARLTVAVLFALSAGVAAWKYLDADRALVSHHAETAAFEREARAAAVSVVDLRAAQQAYVATGQGTDYWTVRVAASIGTLKSRLASLRQGSRSPEAATRLDAALASLDDFSRMDRRAREYATSGQRLLASDLIFADGFEVTQAVALDVDGARSTERAARDAEAALLEKQKRMLAAGVAGLGLFFMLILAAVPRSARAAVPTTAEVPALEESLPLSGAHSSLSLTFDQPEPVAPAVNLKLAADLCLDLARVADTQQIPALLDRAARVLDASGIVVLIGDPDGRELVPTVAHGYPAAAIARVGAIARDADNATAAAYRECRVQTVKGNVLTSGAIVAPLVTPGGCVGVMAAEVRHEREQSEDVRAVAAIIAAQLATLIGVAPAASTQQRATAN